ncbi:hypothetical protein CANARDRAFT_193832 [[Candida] arabinofermentans NRRL YB-2248]|uniref:Ubiquitin carboxyl-terminal hydrolase n=1 Tax=[Candida] arabinofermentans NRRL YB-2248 TaxID=983967 RepID=A0A1E4T7F6_9ASCO|nr:hypothetical protein CANARDRAFT_193832 [[Candida] arabinofermentans NRRL YB-2248]
MSTYITFPPCQHLSKVLSSSASDTVLKTYNTGMKICLISSFPNNNKSRKTTYITKDGREIEHRQLSQLKTNILKCNDCFSNSSIFMCLQCPNIGCLKSNHALGHAKSSGHIFGIDPNTGHLICFKCRDYVGDPKLERLRINQIKKAGMLSNFRGMPIYNHEHDLKKHKLIMSDSRLPSYKATTGLKGLVNMGSTCFMSAIIQTLVHNPFIRDYFFAGSHLDCDKEIDQCLSCCVGEIFQDFYTSNSYTGFGPVSLLTASWKVKRSLAGYSEQDAHEFWQFLLHQLHKNDTTRDKKENTPPGNGNGDLMNTNLYNCNCITHRTFAGELQSSIICSECKSVRITIDPMLDLSLEIQEKNPDNNLKTPISSLNACLEKFTKPEKLDVMYSCSTCNKRTEVTKQLKIKKLPSTLGIQLKRFEHLAQSVKVETHVDIPLMLDMTNYTLSDNDSEPRIGNNLYELFAVVCHIGSVNTGHYICMVKSRDGVWFRFDDVKVTQVTQDDVLKSKAYLLFYIIHELP